MMPASTINASLQTAGRTKNMGDTISRGVVIKSPPWDQMIHLRSEHGKKSCSEDLKH
jgi:hypothetical protein